MKTALVIAATGGFLRGFLTHDMEMLKERGYDVHCAANFDTVKTFIPSEFFGAMGVTFHQIDFSSTSPISKQSLKAAKQYRALLKKYKFDFVHVHTPIPGAIVRLSTISARKRGCKVVYTTHGLTFPKGSDLKTKLVYGGIEWLCSWFSDGIITINREDYEQMNRMACKNVFYINGVGVNTERYHNVEIDRVAYRESLGLKPNDIAVLEVGELSIRKNHKVIIEALAKLNDPNYVFVICGKVMSGSGTYDMLKDLSEKKNVRTIFLGFRQDVPQINFSCDIAVLPSLREGLGFAGIEALASGMPVVGSDMQGIRDYVIDGETGYLCEPTDAAAFADKIKLLSDVAVRSSMRAACLKKAEEFSRKVSYEQMERIYTQIIK